MKTFPIVICSACFALPFAALAFDAGGFAMQQHQHQLLRQQTAPNNGYQPRAKNYGPRAGAVDMRAQYKRVLRPEYDRRVQQYGVRAANSWLREQAYRLGQRSAGD